MLPSEGGEPVAVNPVGTRARLLKTSSRRPGEALLLINDRDPNRFDVHLYDTRTRQTKVLLQNQLGFSDFVADEELRPRLAKQARADGGFSFVLVGSGKPDTWPELASFDLTEAGSSRAVGIDARGSKVFLIDNRGRPDTALVSVDLRTKEKQVIAQGKGADIAAVLFDPRQGVMAFATVADRREWTAIEKGVGADLETISKLADGDVDVISRSSVATFGSSRFGAPRARRVSFASCVPATGSSSYFLARTDCWRPPTCNPRARSPLLRATGSNFRAT